MKICRGYLFVSAYQFFVLTGRRGRRPLQEISNFLMRRSLLSRCFYWHGVRDSEPERARYFSLPIILRRTLFHFAKAKCGVLHREVIIDFLFSRDSILVAATQSRGLISALLRSSVSRGSDSRTGLSFTTAPLRIPCAVHRKKKGQHLCVVLFSGTA